jgi:hypothetical protein
MRKLKYESDSTEHIYWNFSPQGINFADLEERNLRQVEHYNIFEEFTQIVNVSNNN